MLLGTLPRLIACHNTLPCDAILWILDTRRVFFADASSPALFTSTRRPLSILVYFGSFLLNTFTLCTSETPLFCEGSH